jgi:HEAT repeat protein
MDNRLLQKIRKMANDSDWTIKETAAGVIKEINDKDFKEYLSIWKKWVKDPNPNIRRAVEVGLLRINKKHYQEAFELLVPLLYDDDNYVRKNCGPFALSAIAYRNSDDAFNRFRELTKEENQNVRWNIAMCLGVMFGVKYPKRSIELLKILAHDDRRFVWRAVASSLIKLLRRYPEYKKEVYSWRNVDHVLNVVKKYVEK